MTRADIIKALDWHPSVCQGPQSLLVRIERVVAQAEAQEREACARVVEASPSYDWHRFACEAAAAIRARNQA